MVISLLTNNPTKRGLLQTKVIWEQDPRVGVTFAVPTGIDRRMYLCSGTCVANLPSCASSLQNCMIGFTNTNGSTLTINANAGDTIDGATSIILAPNNSATLFNTGSAWFLVSFSSGSINTSRYTSPPQIITPGGPLTLPHGRGVIPGFVWYRLNCITAELGYTAGQFISMPGITGKNGAGAGCTIVPDATNLNIRFSSASPVFQVVRLDTGAGSNITNNYWSIIFHAEV